MVERWSNGPGAQYGLHDHPYYKTLTVVRGSIEFELPTQRRTVKMKAGDRLELPPGTPHSAVVGPDGVECLEAHD